MAKSTVCLPNPCEYDKRFGQHMSRWARPEAMKRKSEGSEGDSTPATASNASADAGSEGGPAPSCTCGACGPNAVVLPSNKPLLVRLGFWRNIMKPRHMELVIDIFPAGTFHKSFIQEMTDAVTGHHEPLWTLNAFMGGDNIAVLKTSDLSTSNPKANAPMALNRDIKDRKWSLDGKLIKKETMGEFEMKAEQFVPILRRFLRWGFAVGSNQKFRFHPFLFKYDDLQPKQSGQFDDDELFDDDLDFINCQGSVAFFAVWWFTEVERAGYKKKDIPLRKSILPLGHKEESDEHQPPTLNEKVARQIAPHIYSSHRATMKYWGGVFIGKTENKTEIEGRRRLETFLSSEAVKDALQWDEERVTREIEQYEAAKSSH